MAEYCQAAYLAILIEIAREVQPGASFYGQSVWFHGAIGASERKAVGQSYSCCETTVALVVFRAANTNTILQSKKINLEVYFADVVLGTINSDGSFTNAFCFPFASVQSGDFQ